jgi:hypothetical protein
MSHIVLTERVTATIVMNERYAPFLKELASPCRLCTRDPDAADQPLRTHNARLCCSRGLFVSRAPGRDNRGALMGQRLARQDTGDVINPAGVVRQLARSDCESLSRRH